MTAPARDPQLGFTLDPTLLARRRRESARRIHTVQIPAIRAIGFTVLCMIALLQDLRGSGAVDWSQLGQLIAINLLYAAISWMTLWRFYGKTGALDERRWASRFESSVNVASMSGAGAVRSN